MAEPPSVAQEVLMEGSKHASNEQNIHTPPASDMSSYGRKGEDDDAASSSELSELDDQFERGPQPSFTQDVPMEDANTIVEPNRYEDGIPIFQPVSLIVCRSIAVVFLSLQMARGRQGPSWKSLTEVHIPSDYGAISGFREVYESC